MGYTNSKLVDHTHLSPNHYTGRSHVIDTITIHCVVGQCAVESLGNIFAMSSRQASSNYGVGYDGRIGLYVEEKNASWCSSSYSNDNRAITIEVASDTSEPYAVTAKAYDALIRLVADICRRNGIKRLKWSTDKKERMDHLNGCNITVHRDYANKSCPGTYLYNRMGDIADKVNAALGDSPAAQSAAKKSAAATLKVSWLGADYECPAKQVRNVQRILNAVGCRGKDNKPLTIDGKFGANTVCAVKAFQTKCKTAADGVVGPATWKLLTGAK